jgi:hypothetical protein
LSKEIVIIEIYISAGLNDELNLAADKSVQFRTWAAQLGRLPVLAASMFW